VLGGNSDGALRRVARYGDGWYGSNLSSAELPERLEALRSACKDSRRSDAALHKAVALTDAEPTDLADIEALGVSELVLVEAPPHGPEDAASWVGDLARKWGVRPGRP
jgi:alkanesulfonate monooxygenase SsuD/methylene tetrahydromethanopterin reductase-like flavin-dependent oxidoreductase (luciferase family)